MVGGGNVVVGGGGVVGPSGVVVGGPIVVVGGTFVVVGGGLQPGVQQQHPVVPVAVHVKVGGDSEPGVQLQSSFTTKVKPVMHGNETWMLHMSQPVVMFRLQFAETE